MEFEWDETKRRTNIRDHKVDCVDAAQLFDGRPTFTYHSPRHDEDRWGTVGMMDDGNSIWWSGQNEMGGRGLLPRIAPMTGRSERTVHYTAEQLKEKRRRGKSKTDWHMSQDEAMQRRHADPEAPRPYPGWEETITVELPEPKEQITLRLDKDMLAWFRSRGKGYQTLMNAVLRGYYEHERLHTDRHEPR